MHRLLERQLRKQHLDPATLSPELQTLLCNISDAYEQGDTDRALMMRSLELTSQEHLSRSRELQQRNEALAEAQAAATRVAGQLQLAIDGAGLGTWSCNISTGETCWGIRVCEICEIPDNGDFSLGDLVNSIYHSDRAAFSIALETAAQSGEFCQQVRLLRPSGELKWLRFLGRGTGDNHWIHGIVRDITEELHATQVRDTLAAIVDSANVAIASTDSQGTIKTWNDGAAKLFGLPADDIIGKSLHTLISQEHAAILDASLKLAAKGGNPYPIETRYARAESDEIEILVTLSPLMDPRLQVDGFSVVVQDITARAKNAKYEAERDALHAAISKLEHALAVVAHELRTPLAGIRATLELLLDRAACLRTDNYLRAMLDSVVQTTRVVNDLLEITRMNSGQANWHWENFEVAAAIDSAINCLGLPARSAAVRFHAIVDPPEMRMNGDCDALTRLIVNFVNNSFKFTSHGQVRLEVTPATGAAGEPMIHIVISDTGKGMSQEILDRLGEPFALNSGLVGSSFTSGTGLGVAICKGIIEVHGGTVQITSKPQQGTTIDVMLRADLPSPMDIGQKERLNSGQPLQEVYT